MTKMRYGPRHGVTLAQTRYDYDEVLDVRPPRNFGLVKAGSARAVLNAAKHLEATEKTRRKKRAEREKIEAEQGAIMDRAIRRIFDAIRMLDFALDEINTAAAVAPGGRQRISRTGLLTLVERLKKLARFTT